jgi:hypothetical protein
MLNKITRFFGLPEFTQTMVGKPHGQGEMTFANGACYNGQLQGGKPHGQGVMTETDGTKYEGNFKDDFQCGKGVMTYPCGSSDSGEFNDGRMHGQGVRKYANGDSYEGEFFVGKRHGQGVYTYANGDVTKYNGKWYNGEYHGQGEMAYSNGNKYNGEFKDGRMFVDVKKPKKQNKTKTVVFQSSGMKKPEDTQWGYDGFHNPEHLIERHYNIYTKEEAIAELNNLAEVNEGASTKFKLVFDQHGGMRGWNDIHVNNDSAKQMLQMLYFKGYRDITVSDLSCHGGTASHFKEISQAFADQDPDINVTIRASVEDRTVIPCDSKNGTKFRTIGVDGEALKREKTVYGTYDEGERENAGCLAQKPLKSKQYYPSYKKLELNQRNQSTDCNRIGL